DMLQAMNTGHDGSLTTVHANGPREALTRMETLVLMAGMELPARAIREQVANALDIVIQQARLSDGTRRITHIAELTGMEGEVISMHNLFTFEQQGVGSDGRIQGRFRATGVIPKFYEGLRAMGIKVNLAIFRNN
ncbi:MAG: CpaF family protein, partial [Hymenobacter sp.]